MHDGKPITCSLYIHIPFCRSFCDYCDFYSILKNSVNEKYIDDFLQALIADIKHQIDFFNINQIPTVYIGGGTPSVLHGKIKILLDFLNSISDFSPVEFTIEANPESVTEEFLYECKKGGVNRLSLGVQSFNAHSLSSVNRQPIVNEKIFSLVHEYFKDSFSVDLITGFPFHDEKIIHVDIKRILDYKPSHVSLYSLTLEKNTKLNEKIKNKEVVLPDSDTSDLLWLAGKNTLINKGFNHYEISNFSINNMSCKHNMRYWKMENWIGAGPSASGTIINEQTAEAARYTYRDDTDYYIKNPKIENAFLEKIGKNVLMRDMFLMGYRCKEGPDKVLFKKRFGKEIEEYIPRTLVNWKDKDKMLFLNQFLKDVFSELK